MNRRTFLASTSALLASRSLHGLVPTSTPAKPDYSLRIAPTTLEIAKGIRIRTLAYNGQVPGPMLRLKEGIPVTIDVTNASGDPDLVHWHGLAIDSINDGAMEEGSPMIPAGATQRYSFAPKPAGTRWYHTHNAAFANLAAGSYSGQFGFLLVEGKEQPAQYDQEFNLAIHHWEPSFVPMDEVMLKAMREQSANMPLTPASDVAYKYATINGHMLGAGEPLRVKQGQRVLFRLLNASATENVVLALPGHQFKVMAMDGNPVPNPKSVEMISLAVAERVDAIVEMNNPGTWTLGSTLPKAREMGLGVVVEYGGHAGAKPAAAVWKDPAPSEWDYTQFAATANPATPGPDETFTLTFRDIGPKKGSSFDIWTVNNKPWPEVDPITVQEGKRYRLILRNGSGDQHPIHLHRHSFEVVRIGDKPLSGLIKDTINLMPLDTVHVDFTANNPGPSLLHCHQQLHMDYGFMQMIKYTG